MKLNSDHEVHMEELIYLPDMFTYVKHAIKQSYEILVIFHFVYFLYLLIVYVYFIELYSVLFTFEFFKKLMKYNPISFLDRKNVSVTYIILVIIYLLFLKY